MHSKDRTLLAQLGFQDIDKADSRHDLGCQYLALTENAERVARMALARELKAAERPVTLDATHDDPVLGKVPVKGASFAGEVRGFRTRAHLEEPITKGEGRYKTTIGFIDVSLAAKFEEIRTTQVEAHLAPPRFVEAEVPILFVPGRPDLDARERTTVKAPDVPAEFHAHLFKPGEPRPFDVGVECEILRMTDAPPVPADGRLGSERGWYYRRAIIALPQYDKGMKTVTLGREIAATVNIEVKIRPVSIGEVLRQLKLYAEYSDPAEKTSWVLATAYPIGTEDMKTLLAEDILHVRLGEKFDEWVRLRSEQKKKPGGDGGVEI